MIRLNDTDYALLARHPLFTGSEWDSISKTLVLLDACEKRYERGAFLFRAGEPVTGFGIVLDGAVHICTDDLAGNRTILSDSVRGDSFGEALCLSEAADSPVYAVAAEDARVLWLSASALFSGAGNEKTGLLEKRFAALLAKRTLSMNSRIRVLSRLKLRDKLCAFFAAQAAQSGSRTFTLSMNREDMAVYIGSDRAALSRELSNMKRDGLIDYYRNTFRILG